MTTMIRESRPSMASINWRGQEWRAMELQTLRRLAYQAGMSAYQGPGWKPSAVRVQARPFIVQSALLAP